MDIPGMQSSGHLSHLRHPFRSFIGRGGIKDEGIGHVLPIQVLFHDRGLKPRGGSGDTGDPRAKAHGYEPVNALRFTHSFELELGGYEIFHTTIPGQSAFSASSVFYGACFQTVVGAADVLKIILAFQVIFFIFSVNSSL